MLALWGVAVRYAVWITKTTITCLQNRRTMPTLIHINDVGIVSLIIQHIHVLYWCVWEATKVLWCLVSTDHTYSNQHLDVRSIMYNNNSDIDELWENLTGFKELWDAHHACWKVCCWPEIPRKCASCPKAQQIISRHDYKHPCTTVQSQQKHYSALSLQFQLLYLL